ncbi:MAG: TlpA disulfide reductase family protein [Pirellulaceae bacterium]
MIRSSRQLSILLASCGLLLSSLLLTANLSAAKPTVAAALQLAPIQTSVKIEQPSDQQRAKCTIQAETRQQVVGWYVRHPEGRLLRRFLDNNGDNKVDQWCYYQNGIEVYRDIDSDFNGTADQSRWLGTAGIRWGIDRDEDGHLEQWRQISAEEVSQELLLAIQERDSKRFQALLLTRQQLGQLQLGPEKTQELTKSITATRAQFTRWAGEQKTVTANSQWVHFSGGAPGLVPAGTDGSQKDLIIYDQTLVVLETAGTATQLNLGTMVRLGDQWKLIDLPVVAGEMETATTTGGRFFQVSLPRSIAADADSPSGSNSAAQAILIQLETLDRQIAQATSVSQQSKLHGERADLLEKLVASADSAQLRNTWIQQLADTVSAAVQTGQYTAGLQRLQDLATKLEKAKDQNNLAYVRFRYLAARYGQDLQKPNADYQKIQAQWTKDLTQLVNQFAEKADVSEAMLQLAISHEFAADDDQALHWYAEIVDRFGETDKASKARGAQRRLQSVGKVLKFSGKSLQGDQVNLQDLRGKVVLIHYWASWCQPCKEDLKVIQDAHKKYARAGFTPLGINLDHDRQAATRQLQATPLAWTQLHEMGGLDSRLANELGIMTLPTMLLVDQQGKVVSRNLHANDLSKELAKPLK